jgi:hypothetical protein
LSGRIFCGEPASTSPENALAREWRKSVTTITYRHAEANYRHVHELHRAATSKGTTDMKASRITLFAAAAILGTGSLVSSGHQAAAFDLSFLNKMNPKYTACVNNTRSQVLPQYRDDRKIHDAIIDACARRYPPFPQR